MNLQSRLIRWLVALLRIPPLSVAVSVGAALGRLAFFVDRRHRKIALDNLRRALGDEALGDTALTRIARQAMMNLGRTAAEIAQWGGLDGEELLRRVTIEGEDHLRAAQALGRGVLCLTGHFGNWEWIGAVLALRGFPIHVVARALDDPSLNMILNTARTRHGNVVLDKRIAAGELVRLLRAGRSIGILVDQNTRVEDAIFVDYFGTPAATHKGPAILALRTGAPVVPIFMVREGNRHRMTISPALTLPHSGRLTDDLYQTTALFTKTIETAVRRHPDHWLWVHRRWKTRPKPKRDESSGIVDDVG